MNCVELENIKINSKIHFFQSPEFMTPSLTQSQLLLLLCLSQNISAVEGQKMKKIEIKFKHKIFFIHFELYLLSVKSTNNRHSLYTRMFRDFIFVFLCYIFALHFFYVQICFPNYKSFFTLLLTDKPSLVHFMFNGLSLLQKQLKLFVLF